MFYPLHFFNVSYSWKKDIRACCLLWLFNDLVLFSFRFTPNNLIATLPVGKKQVYLDSDRAQTVDVMRYLLSYAYDSLNISEGIKSRHSELIEASVRGMLSEFVNMSGAVQSSKISESTPGQVPISYEQSSRPPVQNIEMKRGDWICPK